MKFGHDAHKVNFFRHCVFKDTKPKDRSENNFVLILFKHCEQQMCFFLRACTKQIEIIIIKKIHNYRDVNKQTAVNSPEKW